MLQRALKIESVSTVEVPPIAPQERKAIYFYLAIIVFSLTLLGVVVTGTLWQKYFDGMEAITTPFGIYYFDVPDEGLIDHEECHYERLQDIGAVAFYSDYLFGGACREELRCGATRDHPACAA